jgi:dTDP-4-dehydrorhamnose 3,5-epimerase
MKFSPTSLAGAYIIEPERLQDDRGFFARAWCRREFGALGLDGELVQANVGFNHKRGTLRGMHFQVAPHQEAKLVKCTRGVLWDVIVDLRADSPTRCKWIGVELTEDNHKMIYVPAGFAHGYQTLADDSELTYYTTAFFAPDAARGVRFDDPAFAIAWPLEVRTISARDRSWPDYNA